ncbi:MAG: V-type ATP synthase subunit F [Clostridia bacterium]|nr:V-type ATP synthase subunit F [Clostridia bacterium]
MRFELISNSRDVVVGMRLAGIVGTLVRTQADAEKALKEVVAKEDVAIILINEGLANMIPEAVNKFKDNGGRPLVVVIPDGKSEGRAADSITKYINEAIGLKV